MIQILNMKKILLIFFIAFGLIGSSWSESQPPTGKKLLDYFGYLTQGATAAIELSSEIYGMKVNELIEKRKLLNPKLNQEEIDEIIKLGTDAHKKCLDAINIIKVAGENINKSLVGESIWDDMYEIHYEEYISESRDKLEEVNNRCSLSFDESCEADLNEAAENFHKAEEGLDTTIYYRISQNKFIQFYCPDWNILYSKSIEEITDSDS